MQNRLAIATLVSVALSAAAVIAQQERATFILSDGERMSGNVVFHTEAQTNIRADKNEFNLKVQDGTEVPIPFDHVTLIDFVGGQPMNDELSTAPADGHLLAMRDGSLRRGRLVDFVRGNTVKWENARGGVVEIPINQVRRIYLKADRARELYRFTGTVSPSAAPAETVTPSDSATARATRNPRLRNRTTRPSINTNTRLVEVGSTTINPRTAWTDSGITVRRGDVLVFDPTGTIQFSRSRDHITGPEGSDARAGRSEGLPMPSEPVGALIGRVGVNGRMFVIGAGTEDIEIPANGRLFLGVNDDGLNDNSGSFEVVIYR
jgi:hypothetical protein